MTGARSKKEFQEELEAQIHLLRKACHEFDGGDLHEFRNIARALRVILTEDPHGNQSLIVLAGLGSGPFADTGTYPHRLSLGPYFALSGIVFGTHTMGCRALLDDAPYRRFVSRQEWLEGRSIIDDKEGCIFNRLRLIKTVANSAGGTHYPPDIRAYFARIQALGITARRRRGDVRVQYNDIEKHSLRQIAHELLISLDPSYRREGQFEGGASIFAGLEMILFPGRRLVVAMESKQKPMPAIFLAPPSDDFDGFETQMVTVPYEGTAKRAPCPCQSGLQFRDCCSEGREIDPSVIARFEKKHGLGSHRPPPATRLPGQ